eukprot:m.97906 g.97906  ORF g.97906 m.97906 type:complete len:84 (-) comp10238_c0_seq2:289-540(-)
MCVYTPPRVRDTVKSINDTCSSETIWIDHFTLSTQLKHQNSGQNSLRNEKEAPQAGLDRPFIEAGPCPVTQGAPACMPLGTAE